MQNHEVQIGRATALLHESGGQGLRAHLACANGFPFGAYERFVRALRGELDVFSLALPPLWPNARDPSPRLRWSDHADELIELLERREEGPVIGLGHSMGATITAYAAARRPSLFRALILIEPAMVSPMLARLLRWAPLALKRRAQPMRGALGRRDRWPDRPSFVKWATGRRPFARMNADALASYAYHGLIDAPEGDVTLAFPKRWEAHYYSCPPDGLAVLGKIGDVPTVGIRGAPSVFFNDELWQSWQARCPRHSFRELPHESHLMPLEAPELCAGEVLAGLASLLAAESS